MVAEALANRIIEAEKYNIKIISRGTDVDPYETFPDPEVVALLKERNIDVSMHKAEQLNPNAVRHSHLLLVMEKVKHKAFIESTFVSINTPISGKIFTLKEYATDQEGDVEDPYGHTIVEYRQLIDDLDVLVAKTLEKAINLLR